MLPDLIPLDILRPLAALIDESRAEYYDFLKFNNIF